MGSVRTEDIPDEQRYFGDLWKFRKKFYHGEEDVKFWEKLLDEGEALVHKYPIDKNQYLERMVVLCICDIDERYRRDNGLRYDPNYDRTQEFVDSLRRRRK